MAKRIFLQNNRSNNPQDPVDKLTDKTNNYFGLKFLDELSRKPKTEWSVASKRNVEHNKTAQRTHMARKTKILQSNKSGFHR